VAFSFDFVTLVAELETFVVWEGVVFCLNNLSIFFFVNFSQKTASLNMSYKRISQ